MRKSFLLLSFIGLTLTSCGGVEVSNVVGKEVAYATGMLQGQGFNVKTVEQIEEQVAPGQVLAQEPPAATSLKKGSIVELTISKSPTYKLRGTFSLIDSDLSGSDDNCYGTGGYSDIQTSMPVTIRDGQNKILATGKTGNGQLQGPVTCQFEFEVDSVPKSDFYSVEIGHRGELNYSFEELQDKNWEIGLSL